MLGSNLSVGSHLGWGGGGGLAKLLITSCYRKLNKLRLDEPLGLYTDLTFNSLTPKSDQLLVSSYNITPESNIKVMRIKEMINNYRSS